MSIQSSASQLSSSSDLRNVEKELVDDKVVVVREQEASPSIEEIDLYTYHERNAGRLVIDPQYVLSYLLEPNVN